MKLPRFGSRIAFPLSDVAVRVGNVFQLLARREVSPQTTHLSKRLWGETSKCHLDSVGPRCEAARNARHGLVSW